MARAPLLVLLTLTAVIGVGACGKSPSTLKLSWNPPTTDTSGRPLSDLKGYRISFGVTSKHYTGVIVVNDPRATHFIIRGLAPGRYYFAVSALGANGTESALSPEVTGEVK